MNDLEQIAIQVLAEETGATNAKVNPVHDELILDDDDRRTGVHIHYAYPQWVVARVGHGSSTRKKLDPDSIRAAVREARKNDEALTLATALIREGGRFTPVDNLFSNSVCLRPSDNPHGARFWVWVAFYGSSLVVTNGVPWDGPLVEEVKSILQVAREEGMKEWA